MEWNEKYSTGIQEIDEQHRLMLHRFAAIDQSIKYDKGWSATHYAIVELLQLARTHFSLEEALMRMFGYPETEAHRRQHQEFFLKLESFERQTLNRSADPEMGDYLRDWLAAHMLESDNGYVRHILAGAPLVVNRNRDAEESANDAGLEQAA
jgi:hemerythrin-like metal-binding protein